jgi:hypothetical protein
MITVPKTLNIFLNVNKRREKVKKNWPDYQKWRF